MMGTLCLARATQDALVLEVSVLLQMLDQQTVLVSQPGINGVEA